MKLRYPRGITSKNLLIFVEDSSKVDGSGLTGLGVPAQITNPVTAPTVSVTGGGSTGGALGTQATLKVAYTIVGPGHSGGETQAVQQSGTSSVASGNIPQVTFPSTPTGGQTYTLYASTDSGTTWQKYATGILGATYNMALAMPGSSTSLPASNTSLNSSLTVAYAREGDATATLVTLAAGTVGTWNATNNWAEVDSTKMPGWYQFSAPNALFANGTYAELNLYDGYNSSGGKMVQLPIEIELEDPIYTSGSVNDVSPTTTGFTCSSGLSATADAYKFGVMVFTSGALVGLPGRQITAWSTGRVPTFNAAWPAAPANGDTFIILGCVK